MKRREPCLCQRTLSDNDPSSRGTRFATTELTGAARLRQQLNPRAVRPPARKAGCSTLGADATGLAEDALPWHGSPHTDQRHRRGHRSDHRHHLGFAAAEPYRVLLTQRALGTAPIHGRSKVSGALPITRNRRREKSVRICACEDTARLDGVKSMRNLMLATASAIVLGMTGARLAMPLSYTAARPIRPDRRYTRQGP